MKDYENLNVIENELEEMLPKPESKEQKTYIVLYKGQKLTMSSGKSSWNKIGSAKAAILCHFNWLCGKYCFQKTNTYNYNGVERQNYNYDRDNIEKRKAEFKEKLFSLIQIVEL